MICTDQENAMIKNNSTSGICDPAHIVQTEQKASMFVGRSGTFAYTQANNEVILTIYEKNGKHVPVTSVIDNAQPNLDVSRNASVTLSDMRHARKTHVVPVGAFNEFWNERDDDALGNKDEAIKKLMQLTDKIVACDPLALMNMGIKVFDPLGREKVKPSSKTTPGMAYV